MIASRSMWSCCHAGSNYRLHVSQRSYLHGVIPLCYIQLIQKGRGIILKKGEGQIVSLCKKELFGTGWNGYNNKEVWGSEGWWEPCGQNQAHVRAYGSCDSSVPPSKQHVWEKGFRSPKCLMVPGIQFPTKQERDPAGETKRKKSALNKRRNKRNQNQATCFHIKISSS